MWKRRVAALLVLAVCVALGVHAALGLKVTTDIAQFLPASHDPVLTELSRSLPSSSLNRRLTLSVEASSSEEAARAARLLAEHLRSSREIASLHFGPDENSQEAFYRTYFDQRFAMVDPPQGDRRAYLRERATALKEALAGPTGTFVRSIAVRDPLLLFPELMTSLRGENQAIELTDGVFVAQGRYGILFLTSRHSAFDAAHSRTLLRDIESAFARVASEVPSARLEMSALHKFAVQSQTQMEQDIARVSLLGTIAVVLLLLIVFRNPVHVFIASTPLVSGAAMALFLTSKLFGEVHGLTLAFGSSLIGVAVDYVAHLMTHIAVSGDSPRSVAKKLHAGLFVGALTTVAGFLGLLWTGFPAVIQMAVFAAIGVSVALLVTRYIVPELLPTHPRPSPILRWLWPKASHALRALMQKKRLSFVILGACLLLSLASPLARWQDDLRALSPQDPTTLEEDARVRFRVSPLETSKLLFVVADDLETALRENDRLAEALLDEHGSTFRTARTLRPSQQTALARSEAFSAIAMQLDAVYEEQGFDSAMFRPFHDDVQASRSARFAFPDTGLLPELFSPHAMQLADGRMALLTFIGADLSQTALARVLERASEAKLFDQSSYLAEAYRSFRVRTLQMILAGLVVVLLIVFARYRKTRPTLASYVPAVLAAGATVGLFAVLGVALNLLHVVTLLLIVSMGVDYGVFMNEIGDDSTETGGATVMSLLIAALSTLASFGALGLSSSPALQAIGSTAGVGIAFSLLLAPTCWAVLQRR